jgi:hypothetical protein
MELDTEKILDPERTRAARALVGAARSLDELASILNSPVVAALPVADLAALPTYGGERPRYIGCVSCDDARLLLVNAQGEETDPFIVRLRAEVAAPRRR